MMELSYKTEVAEKNTIEEEMDPSNIYIEKLQYYVASFETEYLLRCHT